MPWQQALTGALLAGAEEHGIEPLIYEAAGQGVAWLREEEPLAAIFARLVAQTDAALARLTALTAR
jgi:hypothetical protein